MPLAQAGANRTSFSHQRHLLAALLHLLLLLLLLRCVRLHWVLSVRKDLVHCCQRSQELCEAYMAAQWIAAGTAAAATAVHRVDFSLCV
jgi:hypothetical protein